MLSLDLCTVAKRAIFVSFFFLETFLSAFPVFVRVRFLSVPLAGSGEHKQLSPRDLWMCMNRD